MVLPHRTYASSNLVAKHCITETVVTKFVGGLRTTGIAVQHTREKIDTRPGKKKTVPQGGGGTADPGEYELMSFPLPTQNRTRGPPRPAFSVNRCMSLTCMVGC